MPYPDTRGGGGAGSARTPVIVSGSPFADLSALNTWSQANQTELFNETTEVIDGVLRFATAVVDGDTYRWDGANQTFAAGGWVLDESQPQDINVSENTLAMGTAAGGLADSIVTQPDDTGVMIDGERTRTITTPLQLIANGVFGTFGGLPTSGEGEFLAPNPNLEGTTFPVTVRIHIQLDNNGNDEGTFTQDYVITDVNTDQSETIFTATHTNIDGQGANRSFQWGVRYVHNVNHATFGQQDVIFIRDVNPETNPALTDRVTMDYDRTVTYNEPATYARYPINAGDGHDDFGLYDPTRYNTEHVEERNRVILLFRPYDLTDVSSDPELGIQVIVDGQKEGQSSEGYVIRLHRTANEFDFTDISFGNNICAVSHIQVYDYDSGHLIGEDGLLDFYNAADRWLGRFRHPTETTDTFEFAGLAKFTGVIGGQDVMAEMQSDGSGGYHWVFTEI